MTTEQIIILGFLALAFLAGWVARALVGSARDRGGDWRAAASAGERGIAVRGGEWRAAARGNEQRIAARAAASAGERQAAVIGGEQEAAASGGDQRIAASTPAATVEPAPAPPAPNFEIAVRSRDELGRAIRAYHAAVVRTFRNGSDRDSGQGTLEALSGALVALSRAVDNESRALEAEHPLTERLQRTGVELRRLADDVMRHSQKRELPAGVFDQLEQHLISAASMILTPNRLQAPAM